MDATANELDDIKIVNYPTIILYKKKTNEVSIFNLGYIKLLNSKWFLLHVKRTFRVWNTVMKEHLKDFLNSLNPMVLLVKLQKKYVYINIMINATFR